MQPSSPPLSPSSISRFSSPSMIPDSHIAAMLVLVNKPDTHSYPVFHVQKDPAPDIQAKGADGEPITAYDQIVIGSDFESDLRMFFAEPKHCSLIVDYLGNIHILNFSGDNPCQLNSLPLSTDTLHPLKDMDVIHVAGKDFRVEYKPGYPIDSQPQGDTPRRPGSPKILNLSPSLIDPARYSSPPRPDTPEQLNSPTENNSPSNSTASLEYASVQEPSSESAHKLVEIPQGLLDLSIAPSPKRAVCPPDTADNSSASMECNTTQPSMLVKDMSTMDVSVEAVDKKRRISDFPKKTISSPIKLKRKSAPLKPTRHSIQFSEQNMDTSTDSPIRRRSPRIQSLKLEPSTPGKTPKKKQSKHPSATPQSSHKSNSPLSSLSQKSVRFGPKLSPEEFDRRLPPSTPVKRGGTPRSATRAVLRRSTPYKVRIPICADLDSTRERRSTSLSPRRTPLRNSPNVAGRVPPARFPENPNRLQRKGLGSRLLSEISESQRFKRSGRISTPTSMKAKGSRIPKPLQSGLGTNQSTLTSARGVKGRIGLRNPQSPEKYVKQIPELTLSVKLEKPANSNNQIDAKESSKSPQNKLPEQDVMTSPVRNPELPSPQPRRSVSPRNFYSSQRSPEFQTPPSRDGILSPRISSPSRDGILSPRVSPPASAASKSAPKGRALTPKSPAFGSSGKVIEKSRTPALRSSSRLSTSDTFASKQENTPLSTPGLPTVSPKPLPTQDPVTLRTRSRSLVTPSSKSKSPNDLLSPRVGSKPRVSTATKSPLARSTPESPEQTPIPIPRTPRTPRTPIPRSATAPSRSTHTSVPRSRDSTPQNSKPSSPGLSSAKNTPIPNSRSRNATPRSDTPISKSSPPISKSSPPISKSSPPSSTYQTPNLRSRTPSSTYQTPNLRSRTPSSTSETPNLRSRTPSSTSETPIPLSASPELVPTKSPPLSSPRTPKSRSATASRSRSTTPTSISSTPKSRSATASRSRSTTPTSTLSTPKSRSETAGRSKSTPTKSRASLTSPSSVSIPVSRESLSSGNSPLPVSPSSPVADLRRSPRLAWESPSLETRSLTPLSIHLSNERVTQRVGTPRPASTSLRNEDAFLPRVFKTPKTKHRTSQPELNFRPSLFDISESEIESPQKSPGVKRSQSLPRRGLELSPQKKNIAPAEDNFDPYLFRSPRSKSAPHKPSEDNFDPHMFRSPHSRPQRTPQKPSEDNFDSELFRSPPTPSFSGGRGTKRSAVKQSSKLSAKVSRSNQSVVVEVSPLKIRETRRMLREKQTASSRAVKRRSDSGDKSSLVKILVLDSPTPLHPEEPNPPVRRRTRSRIAPVAAPPSLPSSPPTLSSPPPTVSSSPPTLSSPPPTVSSPPPTLSSPPPTVSSPPPTLSSPPPTVSSPPPTLPSPPPMVSSPPPTLPSPPPTVSPVRVTRQKKVSSPTATAAVRKSPVASRRRTRSSKTPFLVNPVPIEISPTPIRVMRQRKTAASIPVDVDPVIVSPVQTKKTLRNNKTVSSKSKQPSKGILKTPSKRQKFSDKTSPSHKLIGRHRVRTKTTRVNFASPQRTIPAERSPPPRPPTPQKNSRRLRSQDSPKSVRVTRRAK